MKYLVIISLLFSVSVNAVASRSVTIAGSIPAIVQLNKTNMNKHYGFAASSTQKRISLERVRLSVESQNYLASQADKAPDSLLHLTRAAVAALPPSASLGMNNVPVLDQGMHGTCVTFADTGAIDAIRGNTDYVSQLCNLELGSYLESENKKKKIEYPSGWDGSLNKIVLAQIQKYGVISMQNQRQYGCGDGVRTLTEYPLYDEADKGAPMSETAFARMSDPIMKDIYWRILLNADNAFSTSVNMNNVLNRVKQSIANGNRVVFGTLLDVNRTLAETNGATGSYKNIPNVGWIVTPQIRKDLKLHKIDAGHAMIITGYDDNAEIIGSDLKKTRHKGVLTLRNSWSDQAGDNGNYYMSYEYFKMLSMEVIEISPRPLN
jgi:C1A family cysteine protease